MAHDPQVSALPPPRRRLRIGLISLADPEDPQAISGMPHAIKRQLVRLGHEVVDLVPGAEPTGERLRRQVAQLLPRPVKRALKGALRQGAAGAAFLDGLRGREGRDPSPPDDEAIYQAELERARLLSRDLAGKIAACQPTIDLLLGGCISVPLFELEVAQPIVYFSDTTATLIVETYPAWRDRPEGWRRACLEIERAALARARLALFATELARRSAVQDFGVDPARTRSLPLGANVTPDPELLERARRVPAPSPADLRLVITASDPARKQLDLVIDLVDRLRSEGVAATLDFIGPPTPRAEAHPHVRCAGRLVLSRPDDRRRNLELLADSHLMVMPSLGEAFGIAVAEAAHLGKPSLVSAAGGLPEVLDPEQRSGRVLPVEAGVEDYARAVRELALDPARYQAASAAALERARDVLHWDRFGERLGALLEEVS